MTQIVEKMPYCALFKESFLKCLDPDPVADDFLNLISSSLFIDTSLTEFALNPISFCLLTFYVVLLVLCILLIAFCRWEIKRIYIHRLHT